MDWHERDLGAFGRVRECLPEHYPASFGLRALFAASERRPPLREPGPPGEPREFLSTIGEENRERRTDTELSPLSMICSVTATDGIGTSNGTGWLVSPRVVVTAAHVLCNTDENFQATSAIIRPGREVGKEPFGAFQVHPKDWMLATDYDGSGPAASDFAVILLGPEPSSPLGFFGVGALSDAALADRLVIIGGYPKWVGVTTNIIPKDEEYLRMYIHRDRILSLRPGQIFYDVDTFRGQSGAPVVMMPRQDDPFSGPLVVGIHTRGKDPDQTEDLRENNSATRITAPVMDFIRRFVVDKTLSLVATTLLFAGLVFVSAAPRALAQEAFPGGIVPTAMPLTLVNLWQGNTISLPLTGLDERDLTLAASVPFITRRTENTDVRIATQPLLEEDCGGERIVAQTFTLSKGRSCHLFVSVPLLGPGAYTASLQLSAASEARQVFQLQFTARRHWFWLAVSIFVGILAGGFVVWWRDRQGPIARNGVRVIRMNDRLIQLSAQAVVGASALLGLAGEIVRKLQRGQTVADVEIDNIEARLDVMEEIVQVRRLAAGVPNNEAVMDLVKAILGKVSDAPVLELKSGLNDVRTKLDELRAGGGAGSQQIREAGIDVPLPLPVGLRPNVTESQLRRSIGLWDFSSFACVTAIFIAIAVLSIWGKNLAWGDWQDILGAFLIGVATVGGMDVTLQALRRTLPQ